MKNHLSIAFLLCLFFANAQKTESLDKYSVDDSKDKFTFREVAYMAIFPGCEKVDVNDKANLQKCLAKELNNRLGAKLENFAEELDKKGYTSAVAKLQFVIDKNGKIIQVKPMEEGNVELKEASKNALIEISNEIGKISPATLDDGMPVNLVFQLPVKYVIREETKLKDFDFTEIVIVTLKDGNHKYEIRENKRESNFKVYDLQNNNEEFLGKFNSFDEIMTLDPYKTLFASNLEKVLLAERKVDDQFYKIYYSPGQFQNVEVYKVLKDKEELMESLSQLDLQYSTLYLKIVLR